MYSSFYTFPKKSFEEACDFIRNGNVEEFQQLDLKFISQPSDLLNLACEYGHLEIVKLLLNVNGVDVNKGALIKACEKGYTEIVKVLLAVDGIIVNRMFGPSPLRLAIDIGCTDIVKLLLDVKGIKVNNCFELYAACEKGHTDIVRLLLNVQGIDVNCGYIMVTPLMIACEKGHLEIVKLLLNAEGIDAKKDAIVWGACCSGNIEIVKIVLNIDGIEINRGVNSLLVGLVVHNSPSPLYLACQKGMLAIIKLLLAKGALITDRERNMFDQIKGTIKGTLGLTLSLDELKEQAITESISDDQIIESILAEAKQEQEVSDTEAADTSIAKSFNFKFDFVKLSQDPTPETTLIDDFLSSHDDADSERVQELERIIEDLKIKIKERDQSLTEKDEIINCLCEENNNLNYKLQNQAKENEKRLALIKQEYNIFHQDIHSLRKEANKLEKEIGEIVSNRNSTKLSQLVEERNKLRCELTLKYTEKLNSFKNEKKELNDQIERLETTIREYQYNIETLQKVDKLKLKKEELLKSLSTIKTEIEDVDFEKDTLALEIKSQKRGKKATPQEINNLEKKLVSLNETISNLNESQSEIQQELTQLLTNFPEVGIEMEQILSGEEDCVISSDTTTPEDKFKVFALQNSILLNSQLADYSNREILHTGLSVVYKATKSNNQVVILKEISLTDNNCDAIMNEIMNIVRLKGHSRIIKLNGVFIEPNFNKVYIETPYYSNGNLLEYLNKIKPQHDTKTLKIMLRSLFRKITETIQFIHSKDILHRDLKPHNILINEIGEPIIADFGSSKKLIAQLTNNTMGVGTLKYMANEVKRQVEAPSEKSDIWSLGVSMYECWKLVHNPFTNNTAAEILNFDSNGKVVLPISLQLEIDILLMKMLSHMLNNNSRNRPTALTILTDEDYFTNENPITVDLLSRSNQKLDSSEKLSLWQARLKKLKQLSLARNEGFLSSTNNNEIRFDIDRKNLLTDTSSTVEKVMTNDNKYSIFYKTFVKFKEERGIDVGGLSNELYSKYIEAMLMESKHFQKSETSSNENFILTDEPLTDESRIQLKTFGWLLKKLLIDCDDKTVYLPLNSFIFYYLLNGDIIYKKQALHINDMILTLSKFLREYDFELDNQIMNMIKCKNDKELQSIAYEETFTDVLSKIEKPLIMDNIQLYIMSQLHPYFYSSIRMEKLKLIKEGFDWFNLKQFKNQLPNSFGFSFSYLTELKEFFQLQGSNFVEQDLSVNELKILLSGQSYIDSDLLLNEINFYHVSEFMKDFLTKCIRKLTKSQLRQLLVWMTALSSIPIRGFSRKITIREQTRFEAHTCSFSFDIPSQISNFEEFETLFMNCLRLSSVATMEDFNDTTGNTLEN